MVNRLIENFELNEMMCCIENVSRFTEYEFHPQCRRKGSQAIADMKVGQSLRNVDCMFLLPQRFCVLIMFLHKSAVLSGSSGNANKDVFSGQFVNNCVVPTMRIDKNAIKNKGPVQTLVIVSILTVGRSDSNHKCILICIMERESRRPIRE
jgi:hypothetical protein